MKLYHVFTIFLLLVGCAGETSPEHATACEGVNLSGVVVRDSAGDLRMSYEFMNAHPECANSVLRAYGIDNVRVFTPEEFFRSLPKVESFNVTTP